MKRLLLGPLVWCLLHHPLYGSSANIQKNPSFSWQQMSQNALQQSNKAVGIIYNFGREDACFLFPRFDLLPQNIQASEPEESSQVQKTFLNLGIFPCDTNQDAEVQRLTKNYNEQLRQREGLLRLNEVFDATNFSLTNGWPFVFKKNALSSMIQFSDESLDDDSGPMMSSDKNAWDDNRRVIKRPLSSKIKELGFSCLAGVLLGFPVGKVINLVKDIKKEERSWDKKTISLFVLNGIVFSTGAYLEYGLLSQQGIRALSHPNGGITVILDHGISKGRTLSIGATTAVCAATTTAIIILLDRES